MSLPDVGVALGKLVGTDEGVVVGTDDGAEINVRRWYEYNMIL